MNLSVNTVKSGISGAGSYIRQKSKSVYNEVKGANDDLRRNISDIREVVANASLKGEVIKKGVTDSEALLQLEPATKGLSDYAKANNVNITFYTPQKPAEVGSEAFEKPLGVTVYKEGISNWYMRNRVIDGDVKSVTKFSTEKDVKLGDKTVKTTSSTEDNFLRRVYRNVEEMVKEINTEREDRYNNSFWGSSTQEVKEEIKNSYSQIGNGIKDFFIGLNPMKKG